MRLKDGRLVCFMRTHVNPSSDAKNMVMVVSEDDGFSWTPPKWTNIWGYPPELIPLIDGRYLMIYGYRRPPYGVRGIVSEDGVTWDVKNEFVIREGGVPGQSGAEKPGSSRMSPASGKYGSGRIDWNNPGDLPAHRLSKRDADAGRNDRGVVSRMERRRAAAAIRDVHAV